MRHDEKTIHDLANKILIGRKLKAEKRKMLSPDASADQLKVRKLDIQEYAREEKPSNVENDGKKEIESEQMERREEEIEQIIKEIQIRDMQKDSNQMILSYGQSLIFPLRLFSLPTKWPNSSTLKNRNP
jgi:hypothetical protein